MDTLGTLATLTQDKPGTPWQRVGLLVPAASAPVVVNVRITQHWGEPGWTDNLVTATPSWRVASARLGFRHVFPVSMAVLAVLNRFRLGKEHAALKTSINQQVAAKLREAAQQQPERPILAGVGAGHLKGIAEHLTDQDEPASALRELDAVPEKSRWPKLIPWAIVALVITGFYLGFTRNPDLGWQLVRDWVVINGGLSALGALLAAAHPLTVATAFLAAPITSLNPTIGAGMVTAAAELWLRKPRVADFSSLRHDTTKLSGWWRNRVSRTLLVFLLSTLGSAAGTYIAGFLIYDRLNA